MVNGIRKMYNNSILSDLKYFEKRGNIYTIYDQRQMPFDCEFVQDKISKSSQGVIRGFHGDNKTWKLITCLYVKIKLITFDVDTEKKNVYILDQYLRDIPHYFWRLGEGSEKTCTNVSIFEKVVPWSDMVTLYDLIGTPVNTPKHYVTGHPNKKGHDLIAQHLQGVVPNSLSHSS